MWEVLLLVVLLINLGVTLHIFCDYIRLKRACAYAVTALRTKMDCDELIEQLMGREPANASPQEPASQAADAQPGGHQDIQWKRNRLAALAAGGRAMKFLGRSLSADQIDTLGDDEIGKLYTRYEARLGAAMTNTLGQAAIQLYSVVASRFLPIPSEKQPKLIQDLENDPFVEHALSRATCELYHRYGMYLAPLTAALTTVKHFEFKHLVAANEVERHDEGGEQQYTAVGTDGESNDYTTSTTGAYHWPPKRSD